MHEPVSLTSLFDAAEQAALGGDYAAAARLLEDAAREQEATLGPDHRDLANTLNNLAVAHERSGDLDAAEREYRRAHTIAVRAFAADDPLVVTSAQNLRDFCLVNGRSIDGVTPPNPAYVFDWPPAAGGRHSTTVERVELPTTPADVVVVSPRAETPRAPAPTPPAAAAAAAASASAPARPVTPVTTAAATPVPPRATPQPPAPATFSPAASAHPRPAPVRPPAQVEAPAPRRLPGWAIGLAVVALVGLVWLLFGPRAEAPRPAPPEPVMDPVAPPPTAGPSAPAPAPRSPAPPEPQARSTPPPAAAARDAGGVTIGEAQLCTALVNYRCTAATSPVRAGQLTFYTRLVAARDTAVVHRWYRGDQLRQAVRLGVPARTQGFRTYSRGTVHATGGDWRVELRTVDGQILHVETFQVR